MNDQKPDGGSNMTSISTNEKLSRMRMVAPPRFDSTDDYLAALIFGSLSAGAEFGSRFLELNPEVTPNA